MLTLSQGLGGSPAVSASYRAAVLWSYDSHANGGLYHSFHQGCVAKMVDITLRYLKNATPEFVCLYADKQPALLPQSQMPCAGGAFLPAHSCDFEFHISQKGVTTLEKHIQPEKMSLLLSVEDLMPLLSIGRNTAYCLVRSGQIRSIRIGRKYRIPREAVSEYISNSL